MLTEFVYRIQSYKRKTVIITYLLVQLLFI